MHKQATLPAWIARISAAVIGLSGFIPHTAHAGEALKATCRFIQYSIHTLPCTVTISNGIWKIKWQDGVSPINYEWQDGVSVSDTYREIGNGDLKDARGGVWRREQRLNGKHTYLEHANGNRITIEFY